MAFFSVIELNPIELEAKLNFKKSYFLHLNIYYFFFNLKITCYLKEFLEKTNFNQFLKNSIFQLSYISSVNIIFTSSNLCSSNFRNIKKLLKKIMFQNLKKLLKFLIKKILPEVNESEKVSNGTVEEQ